MGNRAGKHVEYPPDDMGLGLDDVGEDSLQSIYYVTGKTTAGRWWFGGPYATRTDAEPIIAKLRDPHIWRQHTADARKARGQVEERIARGDEGDE